MIKNDAPYHSSNVRKILLDFAREKFPGNNLLISLDADEVFSSDILNKDIIESWKALPRGTSISLPWIQLWRSIYLFRFDNSVWTNNRKYFVYVDDRKKQFSDINVINDHTGRFPFDPEKVYEENRVSVLHFQFVCHERMLSKQNYYMCSEKVNADKSDSYINNKYKITKDEEDILLKSVDERFYSRWEKLGVSFDICINEYLFWYDIEILKMFKKNGCEFFSNLAIWDINWEVKKQMAISKGYTEFVSLSINVPVRGKIKKNIFEIIKQIFT